MTYKPTEAEVAESARWLDALIAEFDGAIKYAPMLADHGPAARPDRRWTREQCLASARDGHAKAIAGLRKAFKLEAEGWARWEAQVPRWNHKIPYVRNVPTQAMLDEAGK